MDKSPRKKKSQYYPFDDFRPPFIAYAGDPSADIPWRELAKGIKRNHGKDSMVLTILVSEFQRKAKTDGIDAAMSHFWRYQATLSTKSLTEDMVTVLAKANRGDAGATQIIVRACPDTICLPFIASNLATMVSKYKNMIAGSLQEIRDAWIGMLPKRPGGSLPYADEDLARIVRKAKQQDDRPTSSSRRHLTSLYDDIAAEIGTGPDILKKKVKVKEGRGRPKKNIVN